MLIGILITALSYTIATENIDQSKIYLGSLTKFENAVEIDFSTSVKQTKEYKKITKDKLQKGTGEYWNLLSKASERVQKTIQATAKNEKWDLVVCKGYLSTIDRNIEVKDVTYMIISALEENNGK